MDRPEGCCCFPLLPPLFFYIQGWLGYAPFPVEFYLSSYRVFPLDGQTDILTHWLADGWFPCSPRWASPSSEPAAVYLQAVAGQAMPEEAPTGSDIHPQ